MGAGSAAEVLKDVTGCSRRPQVGHLYLMGLGVRSRAGLTEVAAAVASSADVAGAGWREGDFALQQVRCRCSLHRPGSMKGCLVLTATGLLLRRCVLESAAEWPACLLKQRRRWDHWTQLLRLQLVKGRLR